MHAYSASQHCEMDMILTCDSDEELALNQVGAIVCEDVGDCGVTEREEGSRYV